MLFLRGHLVSDLHQRYCLSCLTEVHDELEVFVPYGSLFLQAAPSQVHVEDLEKIAKVDFQKAALKPLVQKLILSLEPPTLNDNISDFDRVLRSIGRTGRKARYSIPLHAMRKLARASGMRTGS